MKLVLSTFMAVVLAGFASSKAMANVAVEEMVEAAGQFLNSLTPEQRQRASFTMADGERFAWDFVSRNRKGLPLKEMTKVQRDLAHGLLDAALSQQGFIKATSIISQESAAANPGQTNTYNSSLFYISIFGTPEPNSTWAWRFEGNNLSMNFTIVGGRKVSVTPSFFGASPVDVKDGVRKGTRLLSAEEDVALELVQSLDDEQKKSAIIAGDPPAEILTKNDRVASPLEPAGLAMLAMNRQQGELLLNLVREYVYRYRTEIASDDWEKIQKAGIERIHFAWAGPVDHGRNHYYRIQGPTFVMEYNDVQSGSNYVHSVWRDFQGDFGEDLLKKEPPVPADESATSAKPASKP